MTNSVEHLPVFNGRKISTLLQDGEWYVAIKPICEALGIQFHWQHKRILEHPILGQLSQNSVMVAADGRMREMFCLPEKVIYGWLFSLQSDKPELIEFQWKCYQLLYNHFHGALTGRPKLLTERSAIDEELKTITERLAENPDYLRLEELRERKTGIARELTKQVKAFDTAYASQGSLFPAN